MTDNGGIDDADDRAQMLPDFVIGMAVFLLTIGFVISFIPQMTVPYQGQERPIVAERISNTLADDLLAEQGTLSQLNETCTEELFTEAESGVCPFDASTSVNEQVGVSSRYTVNVSIKRNVSGGPEPEILCANDGSFGTCGSNPLAIGPPVPSAGESVVTSRRAVFVGGNVSELEVSVW